MDNISIYQNKDGRMRVYIKSIKKVMSYPKYLMEQKLGRKLLDNEQVHHKDENPLNNDLDNLEIQLLGKHQKNHQKEKRKYYDTIVQCEYCGKKFMKTVKQMKNHNQECNRKKNPKPDIYFCSKSCSGKYGKNKQMHE